MPIKISQKISIIIPAYKAELSLPTLIKQLTIELEKLSDYYEIIIVDDGSPDETWPVLKQLKKIFLRLKIVRLSRNSGQHNALLCGMSLATGDIIVTMDDDLQNCPKDIKLLITAMDEGYDLVIGSYEIKKHSMARNLGGQLIDGIQKRIFNLPKDFQLTSFRAIRRVVVDHVVNMNGAFPYITAMLLSHTSNYVNIPVHHHNRIWGKTSYTMKRSLLLACNLLFSYSSYPLYFLVALCLGALGFSLLLGGYVLWKAFLYGNAVPGWASLMAEVSFFNALIFLALTIQGFYLFRINQQITRSRVTFSISELV